jgi:hypothetical protein
VTTLLPPVTVSAELAAAVLAMAGIRRGHVVLDLTPTAGLCAGMAAAAGSHGLVIAHQDPELPLPLGAGCAVEDLWHTLELAPTAGSRVARLVLTAPAVDARAVEETLRSAVGSLGPGARVTVVCRPSAADISSGLPAVLSRAGLRVVHAERLHASEGPVSAAVGVPANLE